MDRDPVSGAARRPQSRKRAARAKGVKLVERDGYWHIHGTVRLEGRSVRVRRSTGFAARPEFEGDAHDELASFLADLRKEIVHGIKPSIPVASAAARYLKQPRERGALGAATVANIQAIVRRFGPTRLIGDVTQSEWSRLVEERCAGRAPATRERFITTIIAFCNFCRSKPNEWLAEAPAFKRDRDARNPNRRARRRVADLRPDLVAFMMDHAAIHLRAQMAVARDTGARVSTLIYGSQLSDLILAPGREQIIFRDTKNGTDVPAALTPQTAEILRAYLKWRGKLEQRDKPLFLTHRKVPYEDNGKAWGGQTKTAFHAMRRRTIASLFALARQAKAEGRAADVSALVADARLVRQVTPHWFRHALATRLLDSTGNLRLVMDQGGWLDPRSVMGYAKTIDASRRAAIGAMAADASADTLLTRPTVTAKKTG